MDLLRQGAYVVEYDRDLTTAAYGRMNQGGADICGCLHCRNFAALRGEAYPREFLQTLEQLGIDPLKEGEAYYLGSVERRLHLFSGWFYFIGRIVEELGAPDAAGTAPTQPVQISITNRFSFGFTHSAPQPPDAFDGQSTAAVEFWTHLRWIVSRPEPD